MPARRNCPYTNSGNHQWVTVNVKKREIGGRSYEYHFQECGACGDNNMTIKRLGRTKGKHEREK